MKLYDYRSRGNLTFVYLWCKNNIIRTVFDTKVWLVINKYTIGITGNYVYIIIEGKRLPVHRVITGVPDHLIVDHISGSGYDNRFCNLRPCTHAENAQNRTKGSNSTGVHGVYKLKHNPKYIARVRGKYLGSFSSLTDAELVVTTTRMLSMPFSQDALAAKLKGETK